MRTAGETREYVLAAFQQYLRNQNMLCLWNTQADKLEPHFRTITTTPRTHRLRTAYLVARARQLEFVR